jgi:hypothetical protein
MDTREARGLWPIPAEEFTRRNKAYEKERSIVAAFGYTPFLLLYLLVHTKYLRTYVPVNKEAAVGLLILLPGAWFGGLMLLHRWLGPLRHGLKCPGCGQALVGGSMKGALESSNCGRCGRRVIDQSETGNSRSSA